MVKPLFFPALLFLVAGQVGSTATYAADPPLRPGAKFLASHCTECHDADSRRGNLDLTTLTGDYADPLTFATWVKVHDKVAAGDMPPKQEAQPRTADRAAFLKELSAGLIQADQLRIAREGRSTRRRLNRYEYEDTLRDLLALPQLQVKDFLPEDGELHRFNKVGEALDVSHVNMARYLNAADHALREAMAHQVERPAFTAARHYAREQNAFIGSMGQGPPVRATFPILGLKAQPELAVRGAKLTVGAADPVVREQEAMALASSTYEPTEIRFNKFRAPASGYYRLRFSTYTIWIGDTYGDTFWKVDRSHITQGRRSEPIVVYADSPPHDLRRLGAFDAQPTPTISEMTVWINKGETVRPDAARLVRSRPPDFRNPLAEKDGMPAVAYKWMEAEGPLIDQWPPAGHRLLFGDLPLVKNPSQPNAVEVISTNPDGDAEKLMTAFMTLVYRHPASEADLRRFLGVVRHARTAGYSFTEAMIAGYTAVLSSPEFLYIDERPGRLDDAALAVRLSYFLWNTRPDPELQHLATLGQLHEPGVLRAQTERLLNDPRSRRFVNDFLDYWLDLRKIAATAPDATLYPDYNLDDLLIESTIEEPQLFFLELLKRDLGVHNVVASDFAMLNERMAAHYGIPGVTGVAFRPVKLPANSPRGGFMTQASVLKVTANGTTTSPVIRGAWIMERILGKRPPPPPPSVPAVEPDTSGATTIREQLAKHRSEPSCAVCHRNIDPAGFALESFDPMGGWRDRYRALGGGEKVPGRGHDGMLFTFSIGPKTDSTGELPDGRRFHDVRDLKKLLVADREQLARNLLQQLTIYATGAPVQFGDRPVVNAILERCKPGGYGVRTLVHQLVQSELFRNK